MLVTGVIVSHYDSYHVFLKENFKQVWQISAENTLMRLYNYKH